MSAFSVFVTGKTVQMLTDSSVYNAATEIIDFCPKAFPVKSWTGALTFCGHSWCVAAAMHLAEAHGSFDEFIARSGPVIERAHREAIAAGLIVGPPVFTLVAAGWSELRNRADCFALETDGSTQPAYVWVDKCEGEADGLTLMPWPNPVELHRLHRQGAEPDVDYQPAEFDPIRHGVPLVESQRRMPRAAQDPHLPSFFAVGGEILLTTVTRDGVEQRVIHRWDDVVGEPIRPAPFDESSAPRRAPSWVPLAQSEAWFAAFGRGEIDPVTLRRLKPAAAPAMNRAERRRQEKMDRKLARAS